MTEVLDGLNCMVWVDDVIYWGHDEDDLLTTLELLLERLEWGRSVRRGEQEYLLRHVHHVVCEGVLARRSQARS